MSMLNLGPKFSWLKNLNLSFQKQICIRISKSSPIGTIFTFVLVSFLLTSQVGGQTFSLITPALQQKLALNNLLKTLGLDSSLKANAQVASSTSSRLSSTISSNGGSTNSSLLSSNSSNTSTASNASSRLSSSIMSSSINLLSTSNNSNSSNVSSVSSISSLGIIPTVAAISFGTGLNLNVSVQCVDSADDGTFSIVIGYNSTAPRKEISTGSLAPNRPVIHTHFDRLDKDTLDYNDPAITTKLSGPITYFKGVSGTAGTSSTVADQKAMIIQGQGSETVVWNFTVDGVAYRVGANKDYGTKCNKPTIKTVNASDNIIPPVDNKYIVYDYSNIFNIDNTYFLATENESQEAGTQIKFYSTTTRDKNKPTSLWYMDTTTSQIKSKVDGFCITYNRFVSNNNYNPVFGNKDSNLVFQPCNTNNVDQKFEFKNFTNQAGYTKLYPKKESEGNWTEGCFRMYDANEISKNKYVFTDGDQPSFYWDCSGTYLSGTAYNNSPVAMTLEQLAPMVLKLVSANQSSNPISTLDNYNKFELKAVDCLENAKSVFGADGDVRPVAIGQNGEILSVRITVNNFNQNVNSNTNVVFGASSISSTSQSSSRLSSSSVSSSAGNITIDRVIECKDIEQMQTADLTSTSNVPNPATKSLYGSIVFGSNGYNYYMTTFDDSGLEGTIVGTTIANDKTRKGQNWYYDVESQQIKSAFDGLCLAPIMVVNVERMGLKKCDFTGTNLSQKWNIINTFNGAGSSRIESMRTNGNGKNCMMIDRFTNSAQYGQATQKDIAYDGRVVILDVCSKEEQYVYKPEQNVFVESKIDPRDINLLGMENQRLQKLYNGSVPATSTVHFGRLEHMYSGDQSKIIVGIDTNKTGEYTDKTAFNSGNQIAREYVEYKDGQTGKWQSASYNWKYNSTTKQIFAEYGGLCLTLKDGYGNTNNFNHASANKCSTLDNKQKFNIQKMTDGNYMIQSVVTKECMDRGDYTSLFYFKSWYCGTGKWKGSALTASTSFPIVKTSLPLINILSNTTTNGKKWTLDVKNGNIGDNSELFVWEGVMGNTNQMFAYNPETSEIYYNPSRQTEPTGQKVVIQDPAFPNDPTKKLEVPVFVKNFAEAMTCLDAGEGVKGTRIKINPCSGRLGQKWSFTNLATTTLPNGDPTKPVIKNIAQNFCIDAEGSWNNPLDQMYNGRNAVIWDCTGTTNQQFVKYEKGELLAKYKCNKETPKINEAQCKELRLAKNSPLEGWQAKPDGVDFVFQNLFNPIQAIAQTIEAITNGITTVPTTTSPCYTDTVSDRLVCSIARSPDPVLDPLEAILDSVDTKDVTPPTVEENITITKAEQIAEVIDNQLEQINNSNGVVTDATVVEKSFDIIKEQSNSVPVDDVLSQSEASNPEAKALQTLLNKAPTLEQYKQSGGVINAPEAEAKTSFLDNLNPLKGIKADAQSRPTGSYFIQNYFLSDLVFDISGGNTTNGNAVILSRKHGGINQRWTWYPDSGQVKGLDNKCLDGGLNNIGDFIRINNCHPGDSQKWNFTQSYGIQSRTGNRYCVGTQNSLGRLSLNVANNYGLYMIDCNFANCSRYYDYQGGGGYSTTQVELNCGVVGSPTPQPNPIPTTTTGGGSTGGTTGTGSTGGTTTPPPSGTGGTQVPQITPDTPDPRDIQPGTQINPNEYRGKNYPAVILEDSELTFSLATQIANEGYQQFQTEIMSGISSCPVSGLTCLANSSYRSAINNAIYAIYKLLVGIFKGLGRLFMDFVTFFFQLGQDLVKYGLGTFWLLLYSAGSIIYNAKAIIKSLIPTAKNIYEYRIMNYYDKMEHHGYHIAYIGGSIIAIAQTVELVAQKAIGVAGFIKNAALNNTNIAKLFIKSEVKAGLTVRQTPTGEPVFNGGELAAQTIDDVGKVAPSAVGDMKKLKAIESTKPSGVIDIDHIISRHSFEATFPNSTTKPSKFLQGSDYKSLANEALSKSPTSRTGGVSEVPVGSGNFIDSIKIEIDMGRQIGTNFAKSTPKNNLRIIMDYYGNIITMIPF